MVVYLYTCMVAGAEGSRGAEWLHGHHRRYGDVYVNQGEEYILYMYMYALRLHECTGTYTYIGVRN